MQPGSATAAGWPGLASARAGGGENPLQAPPKCDRPRENPLRKSPARPVTLLRQPLGLRSRPLGRPPRCRRASAEASCSFALVGSSCLALLALQNPCPLSLEPSARASPLNKELGRSVTPPSYAAQIRSSGGRRKFDTPRRPASSFDGGCTPRRERKCPTTFIGVDKVIDKVPSKRRKNVKLTTHRPVAPCWQLVNVSLYAPVFAPLSSEVGETPDR